MGDPSERRFLGFNNRFPVILIDKDSQQQLLKHRKNSPGFIIFSSFSFKTSNSITIVRLQERYSFFIQNISYTKPHANNLKILAAFKHPPPTYFLL